MSSKRQPSKQRRQSQNQRERAARQARREAAARDVASERATRSSTGSTAAPGGSIFARLRGTSAQGRAVRAGAAGALPVGHRAALSALIAAIAGAVVGSVLFPVPVGRDGDPLASREAVVTEWALSLDEAAQTRPEGSPAEVADAVDDWSPGGTEPYAQAYFPISLAVVLPVIGAGIGFRAVSRRASAKVVNRTMYVTLFGTLLTSQLLLVFLPAIISLAVAAFQVRKAEMAAAAPGPTEGVIDVAAVEDPGDDEPDASDGPGGGEPDTPDEPDADVSVDEAVSPAPRSVIGRLRRPSR